MVLNICRPFNVYRAPNIYRILLPLNGRNRTRGVSKTYKNKVSRHVLDIEEVTVLLNINAKV